MEYRIGFFISVFILSFLQFVVHAVAIPDLFSDKNDLESDTASYEPDKFDEELSPLSSFLDDTDNSDTGLFASSNKDECSSWMSADNSNLFSMEQEARLRPRAESCPNQESSKVDIGLPNFGLFQPGSNLFNLVNPPETPLKPPTQIFPELPEHKQDPIRNELNRLFGLPTMDYGTEATNGDEDDNPCPPMLVSDLAIPVCDSGDWARDVLRIAGEYFFDLFNIRAYIKAYPCMLPKMLWCCYSIGLDHHPSYPPDAPLVGVGRLCLNPAIEASPPENDDRRLPIGRDPGKPLKYP